MDFAGGQLGEGLVDGLLDVEVVVLHHGQQLLPRVVSIILHD